MAKINIKFNNKTYSIDSASLADATATLEAHLTSMVGERLEGDGAEYYTLAPTALSFRSTAPLNELQEVQINGVTVDPANYTLEEGSTIVTFPIEYLKTLNVGSYEVDVVSDSKSVKGGFTVAAPELNELGFYYNQTYSGILGIGEDSGYIALFFREDNTFDFINVSMELVGSGYSYSVNGNNILADLGKDGGEVNFTISADGSSVHLVEFGATFSLGNQEILADEDYVYFYNEELGGYKVKSFDKTKESYIPIKTGINNIDTIALADRAFFDHWPLVAAPQIPDTVTTIGNHAFNYCSNLASITLPASVNSIGQDAFIRCYNLTNITYEGTIAQWNSITKGDRWNGDAPATHVHCSDGDVAL